MLYRVVSCMAIGFILAGVIAMIGVMPSVALAQDHSNAPTLSGPANAPGSHATTTNENANHASHSGHEEPPVNPNPLEWRKDTAIWTGVVFLMVFALLYKFAWGPITEGLDKREKGIADNIAAAKRSNDEARAMLDEYNSRLDAAEGEVKAMIDKARADAERVGQKVVEAAKVAAQDEHRRALVEIDQATTAAISELAAKSADLAIELAGKIMKTELKASDHATLVKDAVSNFGKPK